jgi:hypothetical protein
MTHQIVRISVHQTSKVVAVSTAAVAAMLVLITLPFILILERDGPAVPVLALLVIPVIYLILAYLCTAFALLVFNAVAGRVGGIGVTLATDGAETERSLA